MLKSWLLLMASRFGSGNPDSGSSAQEAVWLGDKAGLPGFRSAHSEEDNQALKERSSSRQKTAYRPDSGKWHEGGGRNDTFCEEKLAFQAIDNLRAERGGQRLIRI